MSNSLEKKSPHLAKPSSLPDSRPKFSGRESAAVTEQAGSPAGAALDRYASELRSTIESHKKYPWAARVRHLQGRVGVKFTVQKDGSLTDILVEKTSAYTALDEAARLAVAEVIKFKPLPEEYKKDFWNLSVNLDFILR